MTSVDAYTPTMPVSVFLSLLQDMDRVILSIDGLQRWLIQHDFTDPADIGHPEAAPIYAALAIEEARFDALDAAAGAWKAVNFELYKIAVKLYGNGTFK